MELPLNQKLDDVRAHIAAGRKIEAIKLYREATGVGLAGAKEAVELIEAGKLPSAEGIVLRGKDRALMEIHGLVRDGRKIEAIKRYREVTGLGLKEAKDAIDRLEWEVNPAAVLARKAETRRTLFVLVLTLAIVAGAVVLVALSRG